MRGAAVTCKFLGMVFILSLLFQGTCAAQVNNEANPNSNYTINDTVNGTIIGNLNGTIGNLNGTLNDTTNETFNGTAVGTINGTFDGSINNTEVFPSILLLPLFLGALLFLFWLCRFFDRMNFCFVSFLLIAVLAGLLWRFPLPLIYSILDEFLYVLISLIFIFIIFIIFYEDEKRQEKKKVNFYLFSVLLIALFLGFLLSLQFSLMDQILEYNLYYLILILVALFSIVIYETYKKMNKKKNGGSKKESNDKDGSTERVKNNLIMWLHDIARNFIIIFVVLAWPTALLYFDYKNIDYITFYGLEKLQFPVYIIAASFVGILSYLFLSIEDGFGQLLPEYMKISIAWSYLKRILTAPFIALIGFYLLNHLLRIQETNEINDYFVFVFSFFAGVFTKTIETWIFAWVQRLLPGDKRDEFNSRAEYKVENSLFVKKLGLDEDLTYMLYSVKIRTIEDLASFYDKEKNLLCKIDLDTRNLGEGVGCPIKGRGVMLGSYREEQLRIYTKRAKYYTEMNERNELVKVLRMNRDLAFKLCIRADIKDLDDLKNSDPKNVHRSICDYKKESQEIHDRSCECSEEVIQNYKEKARIELEMNKSPTAAFLAYPVSEKHPLQFKFLDKSTGSPITWKWSFGDGATSNDRNPEHRYCSAKEYAVTLEVENVKGKGTLKEKIDVK